jgi:hypothetical protein
LPLREVAKILDCDPSKISRIESGWRGIRTRELRDLLTEYGVPDGERTVLAGLASRTGKRGWWDQHAAAIPAGAADYLQMESAAGEIMIYQPQLVPDLLQTRDYALAVAAADPASDTDSQREQVVAAQAARQHAVLLDGTASVSAVIGETAVRQQVGGPDVTAAQIGLLARAASTFPNLTVQVLPFTAGAHAAMGCAPFTVVRFPGAPSLGVVYLHTLPGGAYLDSPADLACCTRAFTLLRATALSSEATREMLEDLTPPWE